MVRRPPNATLLPDPTPVRSAFAVSTRGRARQVALGAGVVALVSAVGCGVLLAMPSTEVETRTLEVTQDGTYSYSGTDRKSTRLNSSHANISYAVFCLKKTT